METDTQDSNGGLEFRWVHTLQFRMFLHEILSFTSFTCHGKIPDYKHHFFLILFRWQFNCVDFSSFMTGGGAGAEYGPGAEQCEGAEPGSGDSAAGPSLAAAAASASAAALLQSLASQGAPLSSCLPGHNI